METRVLDLFIVDDNKVIGRSLSSYLNSRFGPRIKISSFYDAESCMPKIDDQSHVIILDYSLNVEDGGASKRVGYLNSIHNLSPATEVLMISSNKTIPMATEEIKKGTSHYIIERERYFRKILLLFDNNILRPVIKKMPDYTKKDFLLISLSLFFIILIYLLHLKIV